MPSPKRKNLPPDLYQKFKEMLAQAEACTDPEMKDLMLEAARRFYQADIKQSAPIPLWALIGIIVLFYLLVFGTIVWAYSHLQWRTASFVCAASYSFMSLLVGVVLRVGGYISESSLITIWKAGFKFVNSLKRGKNT